MNDSELKQLIKEDFELFTSMPVPEKLLYEKWLEINSKEWSTDEQQTIWELKRSIWTPDDWDDYKKLKPVIVPCNDKQRNTTWLMLSQMTSTMPWRQPVGRMLKFLIMDKKTKDYLGYIGVASDFISLKGRDDYIGWSFHNRTKDKMLGYTAMCNRIVPLQPFGFLYNGGKFIALSCATDTIVETWNERYPHNPLVGLTTTSLYGGYSMYNRLKYWRKLKTTTGEIPLEPSDRCMPHIRQWMRDNYPEKYKELTDNTVKLQSRPKSKILTFALSKLKIKPPINNAPRGVYWCPLYENTEAFLRREIEIGDLGEKKFDNSIDALSDLWKEKYAKKRIESLIKNNRTDEGQKLFYDDLIGVTWEEAKEKYGDKIKK